MSSATPHTASQGPQGPSPCLWPGGGGPKGWGANWGWEGAAVPLRETPTVSLTGSRRFHFEIREPEWPSSSSYPLAALVNIVRQSTVVDLLVLPALKKSVLQDSLDWTTPLSYRHLMMGVWSDDEKEHEKKKGKFKKKEKKNGRFMMHYKRTISVMKMEVLQSWSNPREYMSSRNPAFQKRMKKNLKLKRKPKMKCKHRRQI